jgi:hypothetical protein
MPAKPAKPEHNAPNKNDPPSNKPITSPPTGISSFSNSPVPFYQ